VVDKRDPEAFMVTVSEEVSKHGVLYVDGKYEPYVDPDNGNLTFIENPSRDRVLVISSQDWYSYNRVRAGITFWHPLVDQNTQIT